MLISVIAVIWFMERNKCMIKLSETAERYLNYLVSRLELFEHVIKHEVFPSHVCACLSSFFSDLEFRDL